MCCVLHFNVILVHSFLHDPQIFQIRAAIYTIDNKEECNIAKQTKYIDGGKWMKMPLPFLLYFDFLFPSLFYFHILIKYEFPFGLVLWCESSFRYFFLLGSKIMSTLNTEDIKYNQVIRHIYLPFSHKSSSKQAFRNRPFLSPFPKNSLPPVFILAVGHLQREAMLVQQLAWMQ